MLAACFIIDLPDLGGADSLRKLGVTVNTLVSFEGLSIFREEVESGFPSENATTQKA